MLSNSGWHFQNLEFIGNVVVGANLCQLIEVDLSRATVFDNPTFTVSKSKSMSSSAKPPEQSFLRESA